MISGISLCRELLRNPAESALALGEELECGVQMRRRELRPQRIGKIQFRIGKIPQQEIADPAFAAGADQEIGIGNAGRGETAADLRLVDVRKVEGSPPDVRGNAAAR